MPLVQAALKQQHEECLADVRHKLMDYVRQAYGPEGCALLPRVAETTLDAPQEGLDPK